MSNLPDLAQLARDANLPAEKPLPWIVRSVEFWAGVACLLIFVATFYAIYLKTGRI
jgi:hypothetical protein